MFTDQEQDIKYGWSFLKPSALKKVLNPSWWKFWQGGETQEEHKQRILADPAMDPHYKYFHTISGHLRIFN